VPEQYLARNSRTAWRVYDGEAVILCAEDSTLNTLNPVGTLIWQGADGQTPMSDLVTRICAEFDVGPAEAERDVRVFVDKLCQRGLLSMTTSPHEPS
jgi:Coenzyme PQQ synthesis protein D (PqqD)